MGTRRTFTDEFKAQMVKLYESGKSRKDIVMEYELTPSALVDGLFKAKEQVHLKKRITVHLKKMN